MAERKQPNASYRFSGTNIDKIDYEKRKIVNLLPSVNQTETIQKFFGASADHLFEPGQSKPLNGYIGRPVNYMEADTTHYLNETTSERAFYQLEPSMVSIDAAGKTRSLLFYDDLINNLRFQGGLVNDHNRLFSQDYFSWCPSIDLDKFLNYREYCWVVEGPEPIDVFGHAAEYIGDGLVRVFDVTENYANPSIERQVHVTVDDVEVEFTFIRDSGSNNRGQISLFEAPAPKSVVRVFTVVNAMREIVGATNFKFENHVELKSNMRIRIKGDADPLIENRIFIVENVGDSIILVEDNAPDTSLKVDYFVMKRGAVDQNPWSTKNRWFHKSQLANLSKAKLKQLQANRPIIEFDRNIQLYNYGTKKRNDVDLVSHSSESFAEAVNGQLASTKRIDGVILDKDWIQAHSTDDTVRVLVINDNDRRVNNRVYRVSFNVETDRLVSTLMADGSDPSGAPVIGESIDVRHGVALGGRTLHWTGENWTEAQSKLTANQFPIFNLYDANGVALDDPNFYPASTFNGSRLFGFREDTTLSAPFDPLLNIRLVHDNKGEIQFENYLATFTGTYRQGVDVYDLPQQRFYRVTKGDSTELKNDWYEVENKSRQMVVDKFVAENDFHLFSASQEPSEPVERNLRVTRNNVELKMGTEYIRRNNQVLLVDVKDGDRVEVATYNRNSKPMNAPGKYEVPLNLHANAKWEQVTYATSGDLFEHFISIIRSQDKFEGLEYSANNWKDIKQDRSLGTSIVSHTAPLLRTMLLNSSKDLDFTKAVSYAQDEYARFRGKFDQKIKEFMISNRQGDWTAQAIEEIARGMTPEFPFFHSKMAQIEGDNRTTFIPPTPSFLGIYPIQEPRVVWDDEVNGFFIIGHDGSYFPCYGEQNPDGSLTDRRDYATVELERRIYDSTPEYIRDRESGYFDHKSLVSDKFYNAGYSPAELATILRPMFEKWSVSFGIDYRTNDTFDSKNPFTWNWRSCVDSENQPLMGHWRGIYTHYYGTDRPHTHPWEMFGFQYRPDWWVSRYGKAPYGSGNVLLWRDVENGYIAGGPRMGTHERYARKNILNWLPVDAQGTLLDPLEARIATSAPRAVKANEEWQWGDGAPAEAAWKQSFWFPFALSTACYLMKPPHFIETTWDITRNIDRLANRGFGYPYNSELVHSEVDFDGNLVYVHGSQQWVVDYLRSKNKNASEHLGELIRGLDAKLAYKVGGFTDAASLYVVSDNIDRIPREDVSVELYKGPSIREEFLGGIALIKNANGWKLHGYDILDPVFKIIPSDTNGRAHTVSAGSNQRQTIPNWRPDVFYPVNTTVRYMDNYYRNVTPHTSVRSFEPEYWIGVTRPTSADAQAVAYYVDPDGNGDVVERIPYGSILKTTQDVANLVSGYERYLESRGWVFEGVSDDKNSIFNWELSLRDFLAWAQDSNIQEGDMISLIPNSSEFKFITAHGTIEPVEQIVNGVYSILDKLGNPIKTYNTNVVRNDGEIIIQSRTGQEMYSCRIHISEVEHVIVVNNETIFGDIVYGSLFNIRQNRLRLQGYKTKYWKGRVEAPGFLVTGNKLTINFEKAADNFRRLFDIESIENTPLKDRARANYGYQEKEYLNNLLMTPTNQFEFHQGVIQQKGTISSLRKLFRNQFIRHNDGLNVLEEWAFRIGEYGASEVRPSMDFLIKQNDFKNNPQMFEFNGANQGGWDLRLAWDGDHFDGIGESEIAVVRYSINGIKNITMTNKGEGYFEVPKVTIPGDTSGVELEAKLDWTNSGISRVVVTKGGTGYFIGDVVEFDGIGSGATGVIKDVDFGASGVESAHPIMPDHGLGVGSGYRVGEVVRFDGGNGNARAVIDKVGPNGEIAKLTMISSGAGYGRVERVVFPGENTSADGKIGFRLQGGRIREIEVTYPGRGYDTNTHARISGNGRDAEYHVEVTGAVVSGVEVLNRGSGFLTVPELVFTSTIEPSKVASGRAVIEKPHADKPFEVMKFKAPNGAVIKSFTIRVHDEFSGVQPQLTIGDNEDNRRYVGPISLSTKHNQKVVLDDGQQIGNSQNEVMAYLTNAQDSGNIEIIFAFDVAPSYFAGLFVEPASEKATKIVDLLNTKTGAFMLKDKRWVWRHDTLNPDWPQIEDVADKKGNLPSAGYVHLDDIKWTTTNLFGFNSLYRQAQRNNPSTPVTNEVTINYVGSETTDRRVSLIPNLNQGIYRVKSFSVEVVDAFPTTVDGDQEVDIAIGTLTNPELFMPFGSVNLDRIQNYTHNVYEFLESNLNDENAIFAFVKQASGLSIAPGEMIIRVNLEQLGDVVLPRDRAWVYNTGHGDWDVFRLSDTRLNIAHSRAPTHPTQGTVISTDKDVFETIGVNHDFIEPRAGNEHFNPDFATNIKEVEGRLDRVILDGITPDNNTTEMLLNTYRAKFKNSVKIYIDAATALRDNGLSLLQIPIMDMYADSGMVINKITASVVRPFTSPSGNNPTLSIGTITDRDRFVGEVHAHDAHKNVRGEPAKPTFSYSTPITLNVHDDRVDLNETDNEAEIRVVRHGNIYVTPTAIRVTHPGYGYTALSDPKITVLGPTGVRARAEITGSIIGYAVTNAGVGYTSEPSVSVYGGGGTGSVGKVNISNGKIESVVIPGGGTGTSATASISGGKIANISLTNGGSGWAMKPIVTLEGGSPTQHANIEVEMTDGVVTGLNVINPGSGYGATPTVRFHAHTGSGYINEPRVVINGGGGSGAWVEPIMVWTVKSITITDWGKCSWIGGDSSVIVEAGEGGAPAQAVLEYTPTDLLPTVIQQWRYRPVAPESTPGLNNWIYVNNPVTFPVPDGNNGPDFYMQTLRIPFEGIEEKTVFEVEIPEFVIDPNLGEITTDPNIVNGRVGPNFSSIVTVHNTVAGLKDIDLKVAGTKEPIMINERITSDNRLAAFFNSDGVTDGLVTIVIDYHYTNGFELFDQDGEPVRTSIAGTGGDVFAWNSVRFANNEGIETREKMPVDGWKAGDKVWLDDGRTPGERAVDWSETEKYDYHALVRYDGKVYRAIQSGSGAEVRIPTSDSAIPAKLTRAEFIKRGTLYTHEPTVTIDGDGRDGEARATLSPTSIYRIKVKNAGTNRGYTGKEKIVIEPKNNPGRGGEARISRVENGSIMEVVVTQKGRNYDAAPIVYISNDMSDNPVEFECIMEPAVLRDIVMKNRGDEYTYVDVTFTEHGNTVGEFVPSEWELANEVEAGWKVHELKHVHAGLADVVWSDIRQESKKINTHMIEGAVIYDTTNGETLQTLQLYDPYKGYIPSSAKRELSYLIEYDPAVYSNGPLAKSVNSNDRLWDSAKVGDLWWDISTTRYLDYEIGDIDYKWKNWGKLAPLVQIDIYEWTRSLVEPQFWSAEVDRKRNAIMEDGESRPTGYARTVGGAYSWVERNEYNSKLGRNERVYYFWVRNASTLPKRPDRKLTAMQIAAIIQNPSEADIPWFAVIDTNKIIVGGVKSYVNDHSSSLKLTWKRSKHDGESHKQWKLLREADERNTIDEELWDKMCASLVGWNTVSAKKMIKARLTTTVTPSSKSFTVDNAEGFDTSGEVNLGGFWVQYEYLDGNTFTGVSGIGNGMFAIGDLVEQNVLIENFKRVPDQWLNDFERYGNATRPQQSWFRADTDAYGYLIPGRAARRTFVETMNEIFATEPFLDSRYEWRELFDVDEPMPDDTKYSVRVADEYQRDQLAATGQLRVGQKILMDGTPNTNGLWTLWVYSPKDPSASEYGFVLIKAQRYRMREGELWTAVNWYADGWSEQDYPVKRYATIRDRDMDRTLEEAPNRGTLIQVDRDLSGEDRWAWYILQDGAWKQVAKEKSTIRLNSNFYQRDTLVYGFKDFKVASSKKRDGAWELQHIISSFRTKFLTGLERNKLFFSMVKTAVSQHTYTDWAFKSSFLYVAGYNETLSQAPVVFKNQIDNVLAYIDDVKPYHVKVRDYVRRLSPPMEHINLTATDFDKPLYWDSTAMGGSGGWIRLTPNNPHHIAIMQNDPQLRHWYENYQNANKNIENWDANWNPVRRNRVKVLFDRVSCGTASGWSLELPWDGGEQRWKGPNLMPTLSELSQQYRDPAKRYKEVIVKNITERDEVARISRIEVNAGRPATLDAGDLVIVLSDPNRERADFFYTGKGFEQIYQFGWDTLRNDSLADRIENHYKPTATMRRKELKTLIRGCDFRGTIVDGSDNGFGVWDMFAWDVKVGWDDEYDYYVGRDLNINPDQSQWESNEDVEDIDINGGELNQPWFERGHPDELVRVRVQDPLAVTIYRKPNASSPLEANITNIAPMTFRFFKDAIGNWEGIYLTDDGITLATELEAAEKVIEIDFGGTNLPLYNPANPNMAELRSKISLSLDLDFSKPITVSKASKHNLLKNLGIDDIVAGKARNADIRTELQARIDLILSRYVNGVVWIGTERITYTGIEHIGGTRYKLTGATRGTGGSAREAILDTNTPVYDGSALHALLTYNSSNMRSRSMLDNDNNWKRWIRAASEANRPGPVIQ